MTAVIPLSKGLHALVDDDDRERVLAEGKWSADVNVKSTYAIRGTRRPDGRWTTIRLHTFLTGWPRVDHINGNGLDNRRANLRPATRAENNRNTRRRSDNTSGYKGVSWDRRYRKWAVRISKNGRSIHVGYFVDLVEAACAYDVAARKHHLEFAGLNFPQENAV